MFSAILWAENLVGHDPKVKAWECFILPINPSLNDIDLRGTIKPSLNDMALKGKD